MRCVVKHPMIYGALIWLSPIHCFVLRMAVGCPADSNFPPVGEDCVSWANGTLNPHPAYGLWWGAGGVRGRWWCLKSTRVRSGSVGNKQQFPFTLPSALNCALCIEKSVLSVPGGRPVNCAGKGRSLYIIVYLLSLWGALWLSPSSYL